MKSEAIKLLEEIFEIISEKNKSGEPVIGKDHTGTVNWLLDLQPRIKKILDNEKSPGEWEHDYWKRMASYSKK